MNNDYRLVVDIGRVLTSLAIKDENDNLLDFQIIESSTQEAKKDNISMNTIYLVRDTINNILKSNINIRKVDIIIPSRDDLIVSKSKITQEKILSIVKTDLNIDLSKDNISLGIGKINEIPKVGYSASLSLYDSEINSFYNLAGENVEINIYSSLDRLVYMASKTKGKSVIIDAGHSETRILYAVDGLPLRYKVLTGINGKTLFKIINEQVGIVFLSLSDINYYETEKGLVIKKQVTEWSNIINRELVKFKPDNVYMYGGLGQCIILKNNIDNVIVNNIESEIPKSIPDGVKYKYVQLMYTPRDFEINNINSKKELNLISSNIEDYKDLSKDMIKNIDDDRHYFDKDLYTAINNSRLNLSNTDKVAKELNVTKSNFYKGIDSYEDSKIELDNRKSVLSYRKPDKDTENIINKSKKAYKQPSRRESKSGGLFMAIGAVVIMIFIVIFAQFTGLINDKSLNSIGLTSPMEIQRYDDVENSIYDKLQKSLKNENFNSKNISMITTKKSGNKVEVMCKVPRQIKGVEDVKTKITQLFEPLIGTGALSNFEIIDKPEEDPDFIYVKAESNLLK